MNEEKSSFIKGINEQHPAAYHQLYNEYYKALVLYAINFLSSQQAAEDIVQEVFINLWEKDGNYPPAHPYVIFCISPFVIYP